MWVGVLMCCASRPSQVTAAAMYMYVVRSNGRELSIGQAQAVGTNTNASAKCTLGLRLGLGLSCTLVCKHGRHGSGRNVIRQPARQLTTHQPPHRLVTVAALRQPASREKSGRLEQHCSAWSMLGRRGSRRLADGQVAQQSQCDACSTHRIASLPWDRASGQGWPRP